VCVAFCLVIIKVNNTAYLTSSASSQKDCNAIIHIIFTKYTYTLVLSDEEASYFELPIVTFDVGNLAIILKACFG